MLRVLFLSRRAAVRAPLAQALFNHAVAEHAPGTAIALAAAVSPASAVDATVGVVLREVGITFLPSAPRRVSTPMLQHADRVVVLDARLDLPADVGQGFALTDRWSVDEAPEPTRENLRAVLRGLRPRVEALAEALLDT